MVLGNCCVCASVRVCVLSGTVTGPAGCGRKHLLRNGNNAGSASGTKTGR